MLAPVFRDKPEMGERFVVRHSPIKLAFWLLCTLGAVAMGVKLAGLLGPSPRPGSEWFGWLAILFFGFCAAIMAAHFFDDREWIVVDRDGFFWRQWSDRPIPWSAISGFGIRRQYVRTFIYIRHLCIDLHDPALHPRTTWRGRFFGRGWNMGFGDIAVNTIGTEATVDELFEAMEHFFAARAR